MRARLAATVSWLTLSVVAAVALAGAAPASGATAGADRAERVLRIVATEAGFEAPERVPAGIRHIEFTNRGREIHEAMLVQLPEGMTAEDYAAALRRGELFPAGALDASGPGLTSPGETVEIWERLAPGRYLLVCWNHTRGHGTHTLTVEGGPTVDDPPPPADVVVRLRDYRFELSKPLRAGVRVLRFETVGPSMHEADIFRLLADKTVDDLVQWRARDGEGEAPAVALGGILDSHDISRVVWLRRTFAPGRYVLHCEMPMSKDAKMGTQYLTHADAGMVLPFEVAE